jgi:hypothetical protein
MKFSKDELNSMWIHIININNKSWISNHHLKTSIYSAWWVPRFHLHYWLKNNHFLFARQLQQYKNQWIDWLVLNTHFSSISAISWNEQTLQINFLINEFYFFLSLYKEYWIIQCFTFCADVQIKNGCFLTSNVNDNQSIHWFLYCCIDLSGYSMPN